MQHNAKNLPQCKNLKPCVAFFSHLDSKFMIEQLRNSNYNMKGLKNMFDSKSICLSESNKYKTKKKRMSTWTADESNGCFNNEGTHYFTAFSFFS